MSDFQYGTLQEIYSDAVTINGVKRTLGQKAKTTGFQKGDYVSWLGNDKFVFYLGHAKNDGGPVPKDTYPTAAEKKILAEDDRGKIILWQNCMTQANNLLIGVFGEKDSDQDRFKRMIALAYAIYAASLRVWTNQEPIPETKS